MLSIIVSEKRRSEAARASALRRSSSRLSESRAKAMSAAASSSSASSLSRKKPGSDEYADNTPRTRPSSRIGSATEERSPLAAIASRHGAVAGSASRSAHT